MPYNYENEEFNQFMIELRQLLTNPEKWSAYNKCNTDFSNLIRFYGEQNKTLDFLLKNDLFDSVKQLSEETKKLNESLKSNEQETFKRTLKEVHNLFRVGIFSKGSAIKNIQELKLLLEEHNRKKGFKD